MQLTGPEFEKLVAPFFKSIFEEMGFIVTEVRQQNSGTQNGFDLMITFNDSNGAKRSLYFECKHYAETTPLDWSEIFKKQFQLVGSNYKVDGFIVISPNRNLTNIDHNLQQVASQQWFGFPCEFWTPSNDVESIFALDHDLYEKVYERTCTISVTRTEILTRVKAMVDNMLTKKDSGAGNLPEKNVYAEPAGYLARKVSTSGYFDFDLLNPGEPLLEVIKTQNRVALLGDAGTGKSTELKLVASKLSAPGSPFYPFLITLDVHVDCPIESYIPTVEKLLQSTIVVLLDGLDEVQAKDFDSVKRRILAFSRDFPQATMIVSCRSNFYATINELSKLNTLSGFTSYTLIALSGSDVSEYLDKTLPLKKEAFLQAINEKELFHLLLIPYYLIKLSELYGSQNFIARSKADLFEKVISDNIVADIARYYPLERASKQKDMRNFLEKLAFIMEYQGKNNSSQHEINTIFTPADIDVIKRAGSTLIGSESSQSTWKFYHNNLQEYLAAKVLSRQSFKSIQKIIAFPKAYKNVKPTWANTLSFLISILDKSSKLSTQLVSWLTKYQPEIVVRFERDKIDDTIRHETLKAILNFYGLKGRHVNHVKYNMQQLAEFGHTESNLKFLLEELVPHNKIRSENALMLLRYFKVESMYPGYGTLTKEKLHAYIFAKNNLNFLAIRAYVALFRLQADEFKKLFEALKDEKDTQIRYLFFFAIHDQGYQDAYLDFILNTITTLMTDRPEDILSNEYTELKECVTSVKSIEAIKKVTKFVASNFGAINHSSYFSDSITSVLANAQKHSNEEDIYQSLKSVIAYDRVSSLDHNYVQFVDYFRKTGNVDRLFKDVYQENRLKLNGVILDHLAHIATEDTVKYLANEFITSNIQLDQVENFQYRLKQARPELLQVFNTEVNKKQPVSLPKIRQWDSEATRIQRSKETIFDKAKFLSEIERVFTSAGKDELSSDELFEELSHSEPDKYPQIVTEVLYRFRKQTVIKSVLTSSIDKGWGKYSILRIIDFLKHHRHAQIDFTAQEREYIKSWCDNELLNVNFKTALSRTSPNTTSADRSAVRLSFLIRALNFKHYPPEVYLDMLSFQRWDDEAVGIFEFVESIVPKKDIDRRVLENLAAGIEFEMVLESHLEYCVRHRLTEATSVLAQYFKKENQQALDSYLSLGGGLGELEQALPDAKSYFKGRLISELIKNKSQMIKPYLLSAFKQSKSDSEKLELSRHLIRLQSMTGVRFYTRYIERKKLSLDDSSPVNPLFGLTDLRALMMLFRLYEIGLDPSINQEGYNRLTDISATAIQGVVLHNGNYPIAKIILDLYKALFKLRKFLKLHALPSSALSNLDYLFEASELQYYTQKSLNIGLNDAIVLQSSLK